MTHRSPALLAFALHPVALSACLGACRGEETTPHDAASLDALTIAGEGSLPVDAPRAWFSLSGDSAAQLLDTPDGCVAGGAQHVAADAERGVEVLVVRPVASPGRASRGASPGPSLAWPSTAGPAPAGDDAGAIAAAVVSAVHAHFAQRRVFERLPPASAWARGEGDCTEMSDVTAALFRGLGFEARVAGGVLLHDGALRYHAWVELDTERGWWPVDPAFDAVPAGPERLRIACAGSAGGLAALERAAPALRVRVSADRPAHAP